MWYMGWVCGLGCRDGYVGWGVVWVCGLGCGLGMWIGMWIGMWFRDVDWDLVWVFLASLFCNASTFQTATYYKCNPSSSLSFQWTRHPNHKAQQLLLSNATIPLHKGFEFVHGDRPSGLFLGFGSSSLPPLSFLYLVARCNNSSFLAQERALSAPLFFSFLFVAAHRLLESKMNTFLVS